eukprot:gene14912-biopygen1088
MWIAATHADDASKSWAPTRQRDRRVTAPPLAASRAANPLPNRRKGAPARRGWTGRQPRSAVVEVVVGGDPDRLAGDAGGGGGAEEEHEVCHPLRLRGMVR